MLSFIDSTEHLLLLKVTWHSCPNTSIFSTSCIILWAFPILYSNASSASNQHSKRIFCGRSLIQRNWLSTEPRDLPVILVYHSVIYMYVTILSNTKEDIYFAFIFLQLTPSWATFFSFILYGTVLTK